jgi:hypothetical protein
MKAWRERKKALEKGKLFAALPPIVTYPRQMTKI